MTVTDLPVWIQIAGIVVVSLVALQLLTVAYNALARWQIARHTRSLHALTEAMSLANRSFVLKAALGSSLDLLLKHMQLPVGVARLLNPDLHQFELACACGISSSPGDNLSVLPETGTVVGETVKTGAPVCIAGSADQEYLRTLARGNARVCVMSVPIASRNRNLGALTFATSRYRAFTDDEIELMTGLGQHLGIVVENLRMVDALRAQMAQADAAVTDLRSSEKARGELLDNISHELRAPLSYIKGYVDILLEGELSDAAREGLQIVSGKTQQMLELIETLSALQHLELSTLRLASSTPAMLAVTTQDLPPAQIAKDTPLPIAPASSPATCESSSSTKTDSPPVLSAITGTVDPPVPALVPSEVPPAAPTSVSQSADEELSANHDWRMKALAEPKGKSRNRIVERLARLDRLQRIALGAGAGLLLIFVALFIIVTIWQQAHW